MTAEVENGMNESRGPRSSSPKGGKTHQAARSGMGKFFISLLPGQKVDLE